MLRSSTFSHSLNILYACMFSFSIDLAKSSHVRILKCQITRMLINNCIGTQCAIQLQRICYVWQLKVHGNRRGQSNESLKTAPFFKSFRNKSRFTKRRKLYRMLPIGEKANRIYGVIQWFNVLLSTSQRHVIIKTQRYKFLNFFTGERVFSPRNLLKL